jgi:DNA adenine methylase
MRLNFVKTVGRLKEVEFSTKSFQDFDFNVLSSGDFLYADPPYLISCATYNTGWGESDEHTLYGILTDLDKKGIKFALSNVSEHKGQINDILLKWVADNGYHLYDIDFNYDNCNYHGQNTDKPTREIIVTNYSVATPSTFKLF